MSRVPLMMHLTEVQRKLDVAKIYGQTVNVKAWKSSDGSIVELKGWYIARRSWRGGWHEFRSTVNGQVRKLRDINIFWFNEYEVYV